MKTTGAFGSKAGVTLVELLVVMLIVVILTVSLTPLFRDYMIRSQYTAEAVPVVGDLRLKTELFRYEQSFLPGTLRDQNGPLGNTSLLEENYIHTFMLVAAGEEDAGRYRPAMRPVVLTEGVPAWGAAEQPTAVGTHFARDVNVNYANLTGSRMRPNNVFYFAARSDAGYDLPQDSAARVPEGGYLYVIGVFGDGRLPTGTGYAVLELDNPETETKVVATWERWRAIGANPGQVVLAWGGDPGAGVYTPGEPSEAADLNVCWVGLPSQLLDADRDVVNAALEDLRAAGWKF